MKADVSSPFGDEKLEEVSLKDAPLVRVVCQIRFPRLTALATGDDALANAFARSMARRYPITNMEHELSVRITPEGVTTEQNQNRFWQLVSADDQWQLSFSDSFLSVTTGSYTSRHDFSERLRQAWVAFNEIIDVPFVQRVGVRYINRIEDAELLAVLSDLIRAEALGGASAPLLEGVELVHSLHDALYMLGNIDGLQARWGMAPAGTVVDPAVPPAGVQSWLLDLDSFRGGRLDADVDAVSQHVLDLADRAYRYFRWVVTDTFLTRFGGTP